MDLHNYLTRGVDYFESVAAPFLVAKARDLVEDEKARWVLDPYAKGVIGLVPRYQGADAPALVIVYVEDEDYEVDESMYEEDFEVAEV